ncbi:hypothetical protein KI387_018719 [Taxus chinensis]|uniref:PHD-type domain-containing protein n=1 Tax=Taxus chinensis TaxID=29808 RepID=A0AA38G7P8_TAXCH|nr:hypothetical protein KI387_018719 [Taxus chinensis]
MGVDRELRSRKRQTTESTCLDVPPVKSLTSDHVTALERQPYLESGKWGTRACKTAASYANTDNVEEKKDFAREICDEVSKKPILRNKYSRIKVDPSNKTTGKLGSLNIAPVEIELGIKSEDNSDELFPEHNGKVVDTLQVLKGMNEVVSDSRPFPARKAQKNNKCMSSLDCGSLELIQQDPGTSNKNFPNIDKNDDAEVERLDILKEFVAERGVAFGPGWKVQITGKQAKKYRYISPNDRTFTSMKGVVRHLKGMRIWNDGKPGTTEPNGVTSSVSVCLNVSDPKRETITRNLVVDQVSHNKDKETRQSLEVTTSVVAEDGQKKGCNSIQGDSIETQTEPLHEPFHLEMEDRSTGPLQTLNETQVELLSESSDLGTEDRHTDSLQSFKETQAEVWSGSSDLGMKHESIEDKNISNERVLSGKGFRNNKHAHWTEVLEEILNSSCMTSGGIRSSISKALASGPPECAKFLLQQTISKDAFNSSGTLPMKEAVSSVLAWCRGERLGYRHIEKDESPERTQIVPEATKIEKDAFIKKSGRKIPSHEAVSSSAVVTKRCCDVFFKIISSEKFKALCNLFRGSFAGSRVQDVFDFRHIDSRMNSGTYGKSPELFASDMQQLWKNVHKIGKEMVLLTDALSQLSQNFYEKEVAAVLQPAAAQSFSPDDTDKLTIDQGKEAEEICNQSKGKIVQTHRVEDISNKSIMSSKSLVDKESGRVTEDRHFVDLIDKTKDVSVSPSGKTEVDMKDVENVDSQCLENVDSQCLPCEKCDHPSSGTDGSLCKACGVEININCMLICDACEAAYHTYCLSPPMEDITNESWYCSSCHAAGRGSPEVDSFQDRQETMFIEGGRDTVVYHCVVCERLSKMQNVQLNQQAESQSGSKGDVSNLQGEEVEPSAEQLNLRTNKAETTQHASAWEPKLCNEEPIHGQACKVCSVGEKDGNHLIECSNILCPSKFYHLHCLTQKLDTIPPPGWYCPSCLCRVCFVDENDDFIILCDGCDEGYHIYCLNPPLDEIPEGKWYCPSCMRKQKGKRSKKCMADGSNKSTGKVQPKKKSEILSQFVSVDVKVPKEPPRGNVRSHLNKKFASRVRSKKISSMVTPNLPTAISNRSRSATNKLCEGVKPKASRKRKRSC